MTCSPCLDVVFLEGLGLGGLGLKKIERCPKSHLESCSPEKPLAFRWLREKIQNVRAKYEPSKVVHTKLQANRRDPSFRESETVKILEGSVIVWQTIPIVIEI